MSATIYQRVSSPESSASSCRGDTILCFTVCKLCVFKKGDVRATLKYVLPTLGFELWVGMVYRYETKTHDVREVIYCTD